MKIKFLDLILIRTLRTASPLLILLFISASSAEEQVVFKVGYDIQPPHNFTSATGEPIGSDIERLKEIFKHTNIKLQFYEFPWKRILKLVEAGQLDVVMGAAKIPQRERFAYFSNEAFTYGTNNLFLKKTLKSQYPEFNSLSDLNSTDLIIAVTQGASYSDEYSLLLENKMFSNKLLPIQSIEQGIKLARRGRIDGIISNQEMLRWALLKNCESNPFYSAYDLSKPETLASYLMFSKKTVNKSQVEAIDQIMRAVTPSQLSFNVKTLNTYDQC